MPRVICSLISEQQRAFGKGTRAFQPDESEKNAASNVNKNMKEMDKVSHVFRGGDYNDIGTLLFMEQLSLL